MGKTFIYIFFYEHYAIGFPNDFHIGTEIDFHIGTEIASLELWDVWGSVRTGV